MRSTSPGAIGWSSMIAAARPGSRSRAVASCAPPWSVTPVEQDRPHPHEAAGAVEQLLREHVGVARAEAVERAPGRERVGQERGRRVDAPATPRPAAARRARLRRRQVALTRRGLAVRSFRVLLHVTTRPRSGPGRAPSPAPSLHPGAIRPRRRGAASGTLRRSSACPAASQHGRPARQQPAAQRHRHRPIARSSGAGAARRTPACTSTTSSATAVVHDRRRHRVAGIRGRQHVRREVGDGVHRPRQRVDARRQVRDPVEAGRRGRHERRRRAAAVQRPQRRPAAPRGRSRTPRPRRPAGSRARR